jgi:PAS domain S-box-containing protein
MSVDDKVNILMVDDQPGKLLSYEVILGELGENLIKATSGKVALELLLKNDIAVVLMDVSMPDLDGFELATLIRQHPRFQRTAIIFISAVHLTDLDRLKGYQRGAVDYISVPVIPELLRAKVSVFAELHRKARQLEILNRDLEQRVAERTEEADRKAESLQRLNDELARTNQELQAIVQTAPDIIFSRQADGSRDYISDRFYEYTGAPEGSASGFGWLDYVHPEDREQSMSHWIECVQTGKNYEAEYRMRDQKGHFRWFRARAVPIRNAKGEMLKWYGTCCDIHDSKVLEQSIRDNARELERMVDNRTAALRRLSGRLMTTQDEERRRIARELHDGLGQELAVAKMMLDGVLHQDLPQSKETGRCRRGHHHRPRHSPRPQHVTLVASSSAGRSRAALRAAVVSRRTYPAQRHRNFHRGRAPALSPSAAGAGNRDLSHHSGSAHQYAAAFRSAQGIGQRGLSRSTGRGFGARRR